MIWHGLCIHLGIRQRAGTNGKGQKMDSWVCWTHAINGWKWAVMDGAKMVADGAESSEYAAKRNAIATLFVEQLRADLTVEQFAEMQNLNAVADKGICHSHDYCNANEVMAPAFAQVVGREIDLQSDADRGLWNDAWAYAMIHGLGQDAEIEAAANQADATLGAVSVKVGQVVQIKPEWMDKGDEKYTFTAITEPNIIGYFKVRVTGGSFPSVMEMHTSHIEAA